MYSKVPLMGKHAERKVLLMGQYGASVVISLLVACANIGHGAECSFNGQACRTQSLVDGPAWRKCSSLFAACANIGRGAEGKVLLTGRHGAGLKNMYR